MTRVINQPTWLENSKRLQTFKPLKENISVDVVIIGGGITGLHNAYQLEKAGLKVALIEKSQIGSGATEYTTAMITQVFDMDLAGLKDLYGDKVAKLIWQAGVEGINFIEQIIKQENISCEFTRCDSHIYANTPDDRESLMEETRLAKGFGFEVDFSENKLNFSNFGYMQVKNQAKFHPLKYIFKLSQVLAQKGCLIYEKTEALEIKTYTNQVIVKTKFGDVQARYAVVTTYAPFNEPSFFKLTKGMYTTYTLEAQIPKGLLPEALYEDTANPYHYFRIDSGKAFDRIIIGGEDHREELALNSQSFKALESYLQSIFPGVKYKKLRQWTGPILEPHDGLPMIGVLTNKNILLATSFSGCGMTISGVAAVMISDLIGDQKNPYLKIFDPKRIPTVKQLIKKGLNFTQEFLNGAVRNLLTS